MGKDKKDDCADKFEKECREKCERIFDEEYAKKSNDAFGKNCDEEFKWQKGVFIAFLVILTAGIMASLVILFIFNICKDKIKETQVEDHMLEWLCFCIPYMISFAFVLSVIIICLTILFIKINNHSLVMKKMSAIISKFDASHFLDTDSKVRSKTKTAETEFYPKNKALVDNFKAYANAIAEL